MINPIFAVATLIGLGLPILPTKTDRAERRLYWAGAVIATVSAFLTLYPPDWRGGLTFSGVLGIGLVFRAYMTRSYIRIRGRTYAFNLSDSHAAEHPTADSHPTFDPDPDSYAGIATAKKMWWLFAVVMIGCAFTIGIYVSEGEGPWYAVGAGVAMVLAAMLTGNQDSSWGYRVARGQWFPFIVAGIATLGSFTALYLLAYAAGQRWPLRPKRSLEYQRHPHLRTGYPESTITNPDES